MDHFLAAQTGQLPGMGLPAFCSKTGLQTLPKYNDAVMSNKNEFFLVLSWKHHNYHLCTTIQLDTVASVQQHGHTTNHFATAVTIIISTSRDDSNLL